MRLNKALATAGVCSRRKADELVFAGQVAINGRTADSPGIQVEPMEDTITVNGRQVAFLPSMFQAEAQAVYALHKPIEVVTTASDPQGRQTVLDLLPKEFATGRIVPVGRLDYFSEGLLLLTSDGELANRIMHPRYHLEKVYHVRVRGKVNQAKLNTMRGGMTLAEGETLAPVDVEVDSRDARDETAWLQMTLGQGINRQIRRMCRDLDLTVLRIVRTRLGPVHLGNLPKGRTRPLDKTELTALRQAVGL